MAKMGLDVLPAAFPQRPNDQSTHFVCLARTGLPQRSMISDQPATTEDFCPICEGIIPQSIHHQSQARFR